MRVKNDSRGRKQDLIYDSNLVQRLSNAGKMKKSCSISGTILLMLHIEAPTYITINILC